jgi:hypothetical protein
VKNAYWLALAILALATSGLPYFGSPQSVPVPESRSIDYAGERKDYVDSRLCAKCHPKTYVAYQRTAMARSFYRPTPANTV